MWIVLQSFNVDFSKDLRKFMHEKKHKFQRQEYVSAALCMPFYNSNVRDLEYVAKTCRLNMLLAWLPAHDFYSCLEYKLFCSFSYGAMCVLFAFFVVVALWTIICTEEKEEVKKKQQQKTHNIVHSKYGAKESSCKRLSWYIEARANRAQFLLLYPSLHNHSYIIIKAASFCCWYAEQKSQRGVSSKRRHGHWYQAGSLHQIVRIKRSMTPEI